MFSEEKYKLSCERYAKLWVDADTVLYDLCRRFPDHKNQSGVYAKLFTIGRAYATGIERQIDSKRTQGSSMEQLSNCIWENQDDVDAILKRLEQVQEPLDTNKLIVIVQAHGDLLQIVKKVVRHSETPRSFVSKYLHFHNPAVPIIDSIVDRVLRKKVPLKKHHKIFPLSKNADKNYGDFLYRFWELYQQTPKPCKNGSVKLLDVYLLALDRE
jgi:hypothetical protein